MVCGNEEDNVGVMVRATTADGGSAMRKERSWTGMCPLFAFAEVGLTLPLCLRVVFGGDTTKGSSSSSFGDCSTVFFGVVSALTLPALDFVVFARLGKWLRWGSTNPFPLILCGGGDDEDNSGREMDRDEGRSAFAFVIVVGRCMT